MAERDWPLIVRRARADDRAAVLDFASRTWDGWDYVPNAWPHWLAAPDGVVLVATAGRGAAGQPPRDADGAEIPDDHPIAIARFALVAPGEGWLEGIRVDPRVRGLSVATDLQVAELRWAAASEVDVVRYATGERNEASHRLGARHGFALLVALRLWEWAAGPPAGREAADEDQQPSGFDAAALARANGVRARVLDRLAELGRLASRADGAGWWALLEADPTFRAGQRLYERRGWTMQQLTGSLFEAHLARGEVIVRGDMRDGSAWALAIMLREAPPAEDADVKLGLLAGDGERAAELADEVRRLAGEKIAFWLPDDAAALAGGRPAELAGFGFHARPWALHILARPLDAANPPPEPDDPAALLLADAPQSVRPPLG